VEDTRENRLMYCRRVNQGIHKTIGQSAEPVVLACVNDLFVEYQQVNTYAHLLSEPIAGNPDRLSAELLHRAAQRIVDAEVQKKAALAVSTDIEGQATRRASMDTEAVLRAAFNGQIQAVLIASDSEIWGSFDRVNSTFRPATLNRTEEGEEFLNLISIETILHGGLAYTLPRNSMPSRKEFAALFRY
jgi:hypothetical protein